MLCQRGWAARPALIAIKKLGFPQLSMMPLVSRVRMFLDPDSYVVLDNKLLTIREQAVPTVSDLISKSDSETTIRISGPNEEA